MESLLQSLLVSALVVVFELFLKEMFHRLRPAVA